MFVQLRLYISQLALIPRIEVTTIFSGSSPADYRKQDFDHFRCNDSYYEVSVKDGNKRCEELLRMAGTLVFEGATRKYNDPHIFQTLSYQREKKHKLGGLT